MKRKITTAQLYTNWFNGLRQLILNLPKDKNYDWFETNYQTNKYDVIKHSKTTSQAFSDAMLNELEDNLESVIRDVVELEDIVEQKNNDEFYCFQCGTQLHEIGLGLRECKNCEFQFLVTMDENDNEISLTTKKL